MDPEMQTALEAAGWKFGDAADFLGMPPEERQEFEFRGDLSNAIRKRREKLGLSQRELAARLKISQAKVAKIEDGHWGTPLEQMLKAYSALGGRVAFSELPPHSSNGVPKGTKAAKKKAHAT